MRKHTFAGNGNPPKRQSVPVEKDPVDDTPPVEDPAKPAAQ